ncbi:hypothetical protein POM88_014330 [Heracleum sosnowskyi]|uniref:Uncharacterized protein n=1 Tax=Heracleum sosnowskyi TaxID=360622 RepID=A0AAD8J072_9APIA|nr:hypothetical protein POM88_014330 [Heracleum sosnowskyi]
MRMVGSFKSTLSYPQAGAWRQIKTLSADIARGHLNEVCCTPYQKIRTGRKVQMYQKTVNAILLRILHMANASQWMNQQNWILVTHIKKPTTCISHKQSMIVVHRNPEMKANSGSALRSSWYLIDIKRLYLLQPTSFQNSLRLPQHQMSSDRSWMRRRHDGKGGISKEYVRGVNSFVEFVHPEKKKYPEGLF